MFNKNNKYNNGGVLPFSFIKDNRDEAVSEIAEGNIGLEKLLNYCLDNDIVTFTCCSEEGFIGFMGFDKRVFKMFDELKNILGESVFLECHLEPEISKSSIILSCSEKVDSSSFFLNVLKAFGKTSDRVSLGEILADKARDLLSFSSYIRYGLSSQTLPDSLSLKPDTYYRFELYWASVSNDYSERIVFEPLYFLQGDDGSLKLPDYDCYYGISELKDSYTLNSKRTKSFGKKLDKKFKK